MDPAADILFYRYVVIRKDSFFRHVSDEIYYQSFYATLCNNAVRYSIEEIEQPGREPFVERITDLVQDLCESVNKPYEAPDPDFWRHDAAMLQEIEAGRTRYFHDWQLEHATEDYLQSPDRWLVINRVLVDMLMGMGLYRFGEAVLGAASGAAPNAGASEAWALMKAAYEAYDWGRWHDIGPFRDRIDKAAAAGAVWPPQLYALLDDIAVRFTGL